MRRAVKTYSFDRIRFGVPPRQLVRVHLPEHFNCSVLEHEGILYLASRRDRSIYLSELGADFQPRCTRKLEPAGFSPATAFEDPRLFLYRGQLHCSFNAVWAEPGKQRVQVCYAQLPPSGPFEAVRPRYAEAQDREKNWMFFEECGQLYSVYGDQPHVVLRHEDDGRAVRLTRHDFALPLAWPHTCEIRGGAPPVAVGGMFYHWFHSYARNKAGQYDYMAGLYEMAIRAPFEITRVVPFPLIGTECLWKNKRVIYPCGACWRDDKWIVSFGVDDNQCGIAVFDGAAVQKHLVDVYDFRAGSIDRPTWVSVALNNEYHLPTNMTGTLVVDLGANIGSFAWAVAARGCKKYVGVEGDPGTLATLKANLARTGLDWHLHHALAWRSDVQVDGLPFYLAEGGKTSSGVLAGCPLAGAVATQAVLDDAVQRFGQRISVLKLDVEGCEYPILYTTDLSQVDCVLGEYHEGHTDPLFQVAGHAASMNSLKAHLEAKGFAVEIYPDHFIGRRP